MKKILFLSTILIYHLAVVITKAQSTTILPNRLSVPNVSTNGTCDANSKGSTVFNTTDNKMYYCNGTAWQEMSSGGFTLPYTATMVSAAIPLFKLENSSGVGINGVTSAGTGVLGQSTSGGVGIYGYTSAGIGGYFVGNSGIALGISGKMDLNGITGSTGGTATVNSSGNPIWLAPIAFSVKDLGASNLSVAHNTDVKLVYTVEDFDLGNDFSTVNSDFTAPVKGVYHFDAFALWNAHTNGTGYVALSLRVNSSLHSTTRVAAISGKETSNSLSIDVALNANDKVTILAYQNSGVAQTISQDGRTCKFTGHLVYLR